MCIIIPLICPLYTGMEWMNEQDGQSSRHSLKMYVPIAHTLCNSMNFEKKKSNNNKNKNS